MDDYASGYVGIKALAAYLSVSTRTVHRLIAGGMLPSIQIGRRRLVSREAARTWLSEMSAGAR